MSENKTMIKDEEANVLYRKQKSNYLAIKAPLVLIPGVFNTIYVYSFFDMLGMDYLFFIL